MKKLPAQPVHGLIDGLRVLQELASGSNPMSCKGLSEKLGIEVTRVNRILKTFDYLGLAYRTRDRKYQAGPGIQVLAIQSLVSSGLFVRALPVLEHLQQPNLVTALGVLWRDTVTYLYHKNPGMSFLESIGNLQLFPATESSIGMILLCEYDDEEIRELYRDRAIPGFTSLAELLENVGSIRERGFACLSDTKRKSIAVGIGDPAWAAIAVSGNISKSDVTHYVGLLRDASQKMLEPNETKLDPY
jgi:DNA-binding IclR family transcriptional regulator